jgi:hypothetical protein
MMQIRIYAPASPRDEESSIFGTQHSRFLGKPPALSPDAGRHILSGYYSPELLINRNETISDIWIEIFS